MQKSTTKTGLLILPSDTPTDQRTSLTPLTLDPSPSTPFHLLHANNTTSLVQIHQFTQRHGSWLLVPDASTLPPHLCHNGNLTIITKIDPVFLAILVLQAHRTVTGNDVRQPLSQLTTLPDGTDVSPLITHHHLTHICEVKQALDENFYRLCDDRVLAWLERKYRVLHADPHVGSAHALELLAQYLCLEWEARFQSFLKSHPTLLPSPSAPASTAQNDSDAAHLAMSAMMDEARVTNTADRTARLDKQPVKKQAVKKSSKTPVKPSSAAVNFWNKRQTRQSTTPAKRKR